MQYLKEVYHTNRASIISQDRPGTKIMSVFSSYDLAVPLKNDDAFLNTVDFVWENCIDAESKQALRLKSMKRRRVAASSRLQRLTECLQALKDLEGQIILGKSFSEDFELEDELRDSIHLTKERFASSQVKNAGGEKQKDSSFVRRHQFKSGISKPEDFRGSQVNDIPKIQEANPRARAA